MRQLLRRFQSNRNLLLIVYKLLNDLLLLFLLFFVLALIADALIPGIVSNHFSFLRIVIFIAAIVISIFSIGVLAGVEIKNSHFNKKMAAVLSLISFLLIFNSLIHLNLILALFILLLAATTGYLIYKNFFEDQSEKIIL